MFKSLVLIYRAFFVRFLTGTSYRYFFLVLLSGTSFWYFFLFFFVLLINNNLNLYFK